MPKKGVKKGAGGKQSAMTEEERLVYMQQKAHAEDELARRKEDMLTQFLKVRWCRCVCCADVWEFNLFFNISENVLFRCKQTQSRWL